MTNRKKTVRLDVDKALGKDSYIIARSTIVQRYSALYGDIMEGLIKTKNTTDASTLAIRTPPKKLLEEILGHSLKAEKYEIQEKISAGGMGSLYCIFDKDFQRTSVMKVVLPERRDNAETVTSFIREARITAQLEHPNVVPVHDIGYVRDHGVYFTMKCVNGVTLEELLLKCEPGDDDESPLQRDIYFLLSVFRKVCDAVAFAHSKGIMHLDIKPHNIMVGDYGEVLLLDWGLAQPIQEKKKKVLGKDGAAVVEPHMRLLKGSPGYMSPEQAGGGRMKLDERSDIFLLGATLYNILTLFPPYVGRSIEEILRYARKCDFSDIEAFDIGHLHLPEELKRIVYKAMAKQKKDRYKSVGDFIDDLDAVIHGRMDFEHRAFLPGDTLVKRGSIETDSFIIIAGEVEVFRSQNGKKKVLTTLKSGDVVGELAMITHSPRSATVVALTHVEVLVLTDEIFVSNLKRFPPWMSSIMFNLAERFSTIVDEGD